LQYERYGVTSVLTLGLNRDLVYEIRDEQPAVHFRVLAVHAGRGVGVPGGAPPVPSDPIRSIAPDCRGSGRNVRKQHPQADFSDLGG